MIKKTEGQENIAFLNQLIDSLGQAELKLEESYAAKDHENFDKSKKFLINLQKKISEVLK